ncbi:MAG: 30S ribosomal protein S21 [Candidatus Omnitrophica bacterium]|nr:30S ribosomal protein S21 [Candidatus Omnitrophota bacterium]MCM8783597.1 30S ribosomal protein S21 [Candidatus Omnitrophota bacterium]
MAKVVVRPGQSIEGAIRAFRKKCQEERIIQNYKRASRYEKPSAARRIKQKESRMRGRGR